jgi:SAM-dependent methyltransferase
VPEGWTWDETLFLGSAPYYLQGRPPYAPSLAVMLRDILPLDGRQRVLDVGCGPGVLALELARYAAEVIGVDPDAGVLPHPAPPYAVIRALIAAWLGPVARAGQGTLPRGSPNTEEPVLSEAGFIGPQRLRLPHAGPLRRTEDDLVAWVWSLSGSAPHLFGDKRGEFEAELREVLRQAAPDSLFAEWLPDTDVRIWRTPEV